MRTLLFATLVVVLGAAMGAGTAVLRIGTAPWNPNLDQSVEQPPAETSPPAGPTAKVVVDQLRGDGVRAGLLKLRVFRPFPGKELADALHHLEAVAVLDRSASIGATANAGPLFLELAATLAVHGVRVPVAGYVYGLGGRDIVPREIESIYRELLAVATTGRVETPVRYLGVRQ